MTGASPRRYGQREDEPCGSWVPTAAARPIAWIGPRHTCARVYHPDQPAHIDKTRRWTWNTGDHQAKPVLPVDPPNCANNPGPDNPDTPQTSRLRIKGATPQDRLRIDCANPRQGTGSSETPAIPELCATGCGRDATRWHLCPTCGNLLAGGCYGKTRYSSHQTPRRFIRARKVTDPGIDYDAYNCPVCSRWHIGRNSPGQPEFTAQRREAVRRIRACGNGWILTVITDEWSAATTADRTRWKAHR